MERRILNFGSLNLDYVYQVDHFVQPGETLSALSQQVKCGGKGLNQSIALQKAGLQVYHAGCVGIGGQMLIQKLEQAGVQTQWIQPVDEIQGNAVIQVDAKGQNSILLFGGSNQCISKEQMEKTMEAFSKGDYLILQNEVNQVAELVNLAYEKKMQIVLNPSPYNKKIEEIDLHKIDWLLVNEIEAEQISGNADPEESIRTLRITYPHMGIVITLGEKGCICCHEKQFFHQEAFSVTAIDTTAAGDTFTGYFMAGVMEGLDMQESLRRASLAASICVTREGAADSIPERTEVMEKLESMVLL